MYHLKKLTLFLPFLLFFVACSDDDETTPTSSFDVVIENVVTPSPYFQAGSFAVPVGASDPAPLLPGDAYEFSFEAGPNILPGDKGTRLSFVTMFVQSNDLFFAPDEGGIELYVEGEPLGNGSTMDITNQVKLWDAGTEVNDITGSPSQKPQQAPDANDVGSDENSVVTEITSNSDGVNDLPNVEEVIKMTITYQGGTSFLARIENVSDASTIDTPAQGAGTTAPVPMSPGIFVVHNAEAPLFTTGEAASEGIEDIAEDGFIQVESDRINAGNGLIVPLSPGVWAVHEEGLNPLYGLGDEDFGEGLEAIAEDGIPTAAASALAVKDGVSASDLFDTPTGAGAPSAIGPGGTYEFSFTASEEDYFSLATMFVQSNDWFYAFGEEGIALFNNGTPISGDITAMLRLYDAGTEADEYPGAGLNQVIRQSSADAGPADSNNEVRLVSNPPSNVPETAQVIKVTITPR